MAEFLTLDEVLAIHAHQVDRYGGALVFEQAAAYLFHLVKNHPFVDGNKRVGLATALVFLRLDDTRIRATNDELVELVIGVAAGSLSKADVAVFLRAHA